MTTGEFPDVASTYRQRNEASVDTTPPPIEHVLQPEALAAAEERLQVDRRTWALRQLEIDGSPQGRHLQAALLEQVDRVNLNTPPDSDPLGAVTALVRPKQFDVAEKQDQTPVWSDFHRQSLADEVRQFADEFFSLPITARHERWEALFALVQNEPALVLWLNRMHDLLSVDASAVTEQVDCKTGLAKDYKQLAVTHPMTAARIRTQIRKRAVRAKEAYRLVTNRIERLCPRLVAQSFALHEELRGQGAPFFLKSPRPKFRPTNGEPATQTSWSALLVIIFFIGVFVAWLGDTKKPSSSNSSRSTYTPLPSDWQAGIPTHERSFYDISQRELKIKPDPLPPIEENDLFIGGVRILRGRTSVDDIKTPPLVQVVTGRRLASHQLPVDLEFRLGAELRRLANESGTVQETETLRQLVEQAGQVPDIDLPEESREPYRFMFFVNSVPPDLTKLPSIQFRLDIIECEPKTDDYAPPALREFLEKTSQQKVRGLTVMLPWPDDDPRTARIKRAFLSPEVRELNELGVLIDARFIDASNIRFVPGTLEPPRGIDTPPPTNPQPVLRSFQLSKQLEWRLMHAMKELSEPGYDDLFAKGLRDILSDLAIVPTPKGVSSSSRSITVQFLIEYGNRPEASAKKILLLMRPVDASTPASSIARSIDVIRHADDDESTMRDVRVVIVTLPWPEEDEKSVRFRQQLQDANLDFPQ
ncbi:MAG: hypothetical protein R3C01_12345 [Planctomycetaceae bacterium]